MNGEEKNQEKLGVENARWEESRKQGAIGTIAVGKHHIKNKCQLKKYHREK